MKISMFSAALDLEKDPDDADRGIELIGNVVLKFGNEEVMEWPITANTARFMTVDETALDRFVADKFRELFENAE